MSKFFTIGLLIMPWIFYLDKNITNQFRIPQNMIMSIIFLGMIIYYINNGAKFVYKNKYLAWFLIWVFIVLIANFFMPFSIETEQGRMLPVKCLDHTINIILAVFATCIALTSFDKDDYIKIAKVLCVSSCIISIVALFQFFGFNMISFQSALLSINSNYNCDNKVSACLDNPNIVGAYLAICSPLFLIFKKYKWYLLIIPAIIITKCETAYFMFISSMCIFLFLKYSQKKWVRISVLSLLFIPTGIIIWLSTLSWETLNRLSNFRVTCWGIVCDGIRAVSMGTGFGSFMAERIYLNSTTWNEAHSDWLQYTLELGVIGIGLFILLIYKTLKNADKASDFNLAYLSMFIGFLICMLTSFPIEVPSLGILGLIGFWGISKSI